MDQSLSLLLFLITVIVLFLIICSFPTINSGQSSVNMLSGEATCGYNQEDIQNGYVPSDIAATCNCSTSSYSSEEITTIGCTPSSCGFNCTCANNNPGTVVLSAPIDIGIDPVSGVLGFVSDNTPAYAVAYSNVNSDDTTQNDDYVLCVNTQVISGESNDVAICAGYYKNNLGQYVNVMYFLFNHNFESYGIKGKWNLTINGYPTDVIQCSDYTRCIANGPGLYICPISLVNPGVNNEIQFTSNNCEVGKDCGENEGGYPFQYTGTGNIGYVDKHPVRLAFALTPNPSNNNTDYFISLGISSMILAANSWISVYPTTTKLKVDTTPDSVIDIFVDSTIVVVI